MQEYKSDSYIQSWESIADDWVKHADTNDYRNHFLLPTTLDLLGDVAGKRILDVGCGEGGYSRALALRGAQVTGIDGSARLIEVARERAQVQELTIKYLVQNANSMSGVDTHAFDIVLAAMSLMDVEDYIGSITEIKRVLKPEGYLLMSITHPCFSAPVSKWERDSKGNLVHFIVDQYFDKIAWESFITDKFRKPVLRRHMPLQDFINPLIKQGFSLALFLEPVPTDEQIQKSPRFPRLKRIPYFLFMKWTLSREIE
jgi:2-polyprenyl-3-methyl-5-hydroxy-6-metoxy-1,4-benzoquinol methylase